MVVFLSTASLLLSSLGILVVGFTYRRTLHELNPKRQMVIVMFLAAVLIGMFYTVGHWSVQPDVLIPVLWVVVPGLTSLAALIAERNLRHYKFFNPSRDDAGI